MIVSDLCEYLDGLRVVGPYPEPTVDTIKAGDPSTEVRGIAVGWMSYTWAIEEAIASGCNVFVTHEPTYFDHYDDNPELDALPGVRAKRAFIEETGIVILRCHDVWDQLPEMGIGDSWGRWLGLTDPVAGDRFLRVYRVTPRSALDFARQVARRVAPLGQDTVHLAGPADRIVERIVTGTGAITPFPEMLIRFDADLAVTTDDGTHYWRDAGLAIDLGRPVIVVHHPVSEEPGVASLARHLSSAFPGLPVRHIEQSCMYREVRATDELAQRERREG